ncbi:MAG: family 43 glycosylhydrolase [Eubacteriales bacterium]|nr:family 43 glycosylhydrolase [Eubacteriales bacterium]
MKKIFLLFTVLLFCCVSFSLLFSVSLYGEEPLVLYVNAESGSDDADGRSDAVPLKTIDAAIRAAGDGDLTIVFTGNYTVKEHYTEPLHKGTVTYTAKTDSRSYDAVFSFANVRALTFNCSGPVVFRDITIKTVNFAIIAAQFNPLVFDEGVATIGGSSYLFALGGYDAPADANLPTNRNSSLTINSGSFYKVSGFCRAKGNTTSLSYTGVASITVNGGTIGTLYGASIDYYYSGGVRITVNDGKITTLCAGGNASRRLDGVATLILNGGTVGAVKINNATAGARVELAGTKYSTLEKSFYNVSLESIAEKAGSTFLLRYNSLLYTEKQAESFAKIFDSVENNASVFVRDGASGNGFSESSPIGSFAAAVSMLKQVGGTIVLSGSVDCDTVQIECGGPITVTGGELRLPPDGVTVASDLTVASVTLSAEKATLVTVKGSRLLIGEEVDSLPLVSLLLAEGARAEMLSGTFGSVTVDGNCFFEAVNGSLDTVNVTSGAGESVVFTVESAAVKMLSVNAAGNVSLGLYGGSIASVSVDRADKLSVLLGAITARTEKLNADQILLWCTPAADEKLATSFETAGAVRTNSTYIYIRNGGKGDGSTPHSAASSLSKVNGISGRVTAVLCGEARVPSMTFKNDTGLTLTSRDPIRDYREDGAVAQLRGNPTFDCETTIEYLTLEADATRRLYGGGNRFVIGDGVSCVLSGGNTVYPYLIGGGTASTSSETANMTVNSGDWGVLRAGSENKGKGSDLSIRCVINGGVFHNYLALSSRGENTGTIDAEINGGTFYQGIFAVYEEDGASYFAKYDINLVINGGTPYGAIAPAKSAETALYGSYKLTLNGGNFGHVTDVWGAERYLGKMTSEIVYGVSLDENAAMEGEVSFTNPIRKGADPHLFYFDGYYYLCCTGSTTITLFKAANLADLATAASYTIIRPTYGKNLWSPEIHRFTEEEVGAQNAGWYIFFGFDDGTTSNQRQYCLRLQGEDLLGKWVNPVTGKQNEPQKIKVKNQPELNEEALCGGSSVIRINGKTYITFVSETGRGTKDFHQIIYICAFENPWTYIGPATAICVPEYDWEAGGYGQDSSTGLWYPKVVEGAAAVYGDNGEIYLMYTGSGYWTIYYQLGFLKYVGGDPLDASSWQKTPKPVFSLSDEVNGCGHGSYTTDWTGSHWIAYHGYLGKDTESKRYVFFEPYTVSDKTVTIGDGSGHPAALSTVYTLPINPMSVSERVSGFDSALKATGEDPVITVPLTTSGESMNTTVPDVTSEPSTSTDTGTRRPLMPWIWIVALCFLSAPVLLILRKRKRK